MDESFLQKKALKMSSRVQKMHYAIRDLLSVANEVEAAGKQVIKLNIGDPLKYDFSTPHVMIEGMCKASKEGHNYYSDSLGHIEIRTAIKEREHQFNGIDLELGDILFTQGVSEAIYFLFAAFTDRGDEVLLPSPTYPAYQSVGTVMEANMKYYGLYEEDGWLPREENIRGLITDKTRFISIINPNNPTGAVYPEKTLKMIRDIAGEYGIPLISDEIYDRLVFDTKYTSITQVSKDVPVIVFNGFSKVYLAPGWRAGYAYRLDPVGLLDEPWEGMKKMARIRLSASTPIQFGCAEILRHELSYLPEVITKLKRRKDLVVKRFSETDLLSLVEPKAAFYAFPRVKIEDTVFTNDLKYVKALIKEAQVLVVNGSGFGSPYGDNHFRLVYLAQEEILDDALTRIITFTEQHKK